MLGRQIYIFQVKIAKGTAKNSSLNYWAQKLHVGVFQADRRQGVIKDATRLIVGMMDIFNDSCKNMKREKSAFPSTLSL